MSYLVAFDTCDRGHRTLKPCVLGARSCTFCANTPRSLSSLLLGDWLPPTTWSIGTSIGRFSWVMVSWGNEAPRRSRLSGTPARHASAMTCSVTGFQSSPKSSTGLFQELLSSPFHGIFAFTHFAQDLFMSLKRSKRLRLDGNVVLQ